MDFKACCGETQKLSGFEDHNKIQESVRPFRKSSSPDKMEAVYGRGRSFIKWPSHYLPNRTPGKPTTSITLEETGNFSDGELKRAAEDTRLVMLQPLVSVNLVKKAEAERLERELKMKEPLEKSPDCLLNRRGRRMRITCKHLIIFRPAISK